MTLGSSILVTGGTGSFGKAFVRTLLESHPEVKRIVVFSRDELKQFEMQQEPAFRSPKLRYFIGDIRDEARVRRALESVDTIVHAAALKQVPAAEQNPMEAIKTNVLGAQNLIEAALDSDVKRVVALSTDKAAAPINLYGATKLCSDKLFTAANQMRGSRDLRFSVVRYGNVMGSRGSVIPFFLEARTKGVLPITHPEMTRFNITLGEGVALVVSALTTMWGGEIFVPKIPSYRILDVAEAIAPGVPTEVVGIRPGEKLHEEMITQADSQKTCDLGDRYVILPALSWWKSEEYVAENHAASVPLGFSYRSNENTEWLDVESIRRLIRAHVDPSFEPTGAA
jgi:UDP-N-acetylglucosamine 4,6-dehydratase/5-epimerase